MGAAELSLILAVMVGLLLGAGIAYLVLTHFTQQHLKQETEIIIERGKLREKVMKQGKLTLIDIKNALKEQGCDSMGQVTFAILEKGGKISVIQKDASYPATS